MSLPHTPHTPTLLLSPACRARRPGEWSRTTSVTFIVTLAATRSVTLAARAAGMSRKSAYALKLRDSAFAEAWHSALDAPRPGRQGDKARAAAPSTSSTRERCNRPRDRARDRLRDRLRNRLRDEVARDLFFARLATQQTRLAAANLESPPNITGAASGGLLPSRKSLSL